MSLGAKINIGLLALLMLLGLAASGIVLFGFNRTRQNAADRSNDALEEQGKLTLLALAGGLSDIGGIEAERAGAVGQSAARYLDDASDQHIATLVDASGFVRNARGIWYDPAPDRVSDVVVVGAAGIDAAAFDDIVYSAPLDALFPALADSFSGQISQGFRPIAIVFASANSVGRYYPAIGIQDTIPVDIDVSDLLNGLGPSANPERATFWTAPYEDVQGRGLVMTAQTPVYDGDTYRGAIEVDISISNLAGLLDTVHPTPSGFAFYLARDGSILGTTAAALFSPASASDSAVAEILGTMQAAKPGDGAASDSRVLTLEGRQYLLAYVAVSGFGGSVAAVAPIDEVTAGASPITSGIDEDANRTLWIMLAAIGALFVAGLAGATYLNRKAIIGPIAALAGATGRVSAGDLSVSVPVDRGDELGELAADFNVMVEKLRESERVLEQRVEDRTRELDALLRADAELFRSLDLDTVLAALVDVAIDVIGADKCLVTLWDRDRNAVTVRAARSFSARGLDLFTELLPAPGLGSLRDDVEPTVHKQLGDPSMPPAVRAIMELEGVAAAMDVPIRSVSGVVLGGYGVAYTTSHHFDSDEKRLLLALAERAAVAIQNADLFARAQQAASLEERQRLARELHDSVSQALYGIALGTRTARLRLGDDPHNAAEPIDYVASLAQAGLAEMRALIFELRPESLEQEGLIAAIEKQAASIAARYKLDVHLDLGEEPDCPLDLKEALYRIAQESLHNVVKHAHAQRVDVRLQRSDGAISLIVKDDGRGFDPSQPFPGHVGLRSMPERAERLGGTVTIDSAPGSGTIVTASLPAA
jgi:signal transduction histidine kinase